MSKDITTVIGDDISFRGTLDFTKGLQINGEFKGKINSNGHLVVGETSSIDADIKASTVTIKGNFKGTIIAEKKVYLLPSGRVKGDIHAPDLQIESGSRFSGNCSMEN